MKKADIFDVTMGAFMILLGLAAVLMAGAVAYESIMRTYDNHLERKSKIQTEAK